MSNSSYKSQVATSVQELQTAISEISQIQQQLKSNYSSVGGHHFVSAFDVLIDKLNRAKVRLQNLE